MWRALLMCLGVGACLPLAALDAFGVELTDPRIVISGQVVDSVKAPVSDAHVQAASRTTAVTVHTDRSGKFTVALPVETGHMGDKCSDTWVTGLAGKAKAA